MDTRPGITPQGPSLAPLSHAQAVDPPLWELIHRFTGNQYRFLLAFLRDPEQPHNAVARSIGLTPESVYGWRYATPGFKDALDAIRAHRPQLRHEYAKLAFEGAIPNIADKMIERAQGDKRDAQRAAERILETVGVLQKEPMVVVQEPSRDMLTELRRLTAIAMGKQITVEKPLAMDAEAKVARVLGPGKTPGGGDDAQEKIDPDANK